MKEKMLIVCLTGNIWLYQGLAALLSTQKVIRVDYYDVSFPAYLWSAKNCILLTDMTIFLAGEWAAFESILGQKPDARVIWLKRPDSGALFPAERYGDPILEQKQNIRKFRNKLWQFILFPDTVLNEEKVNNVCLTRKDKTLLPYFIQESNMKIIAEKTGLALKTLYNRRNRISLDMGFPHFTAMKQVIKNNMHLFHQVIKPQD